MPKKVLKVVNFGSAKTGIATVGYTVYGIDGSEAYARSTADVVELGSTGCYVAPVTVPDYDSITMWDTGEATPRYAPESNTIQVNTIAEEASKIQKIWNSIKNQGDFMATLMDRMGLLVKNEGMKKVNAKIDSISQQPKPPQLLDIEGAFMRAAGNIKIDIPKQDSKDYSNQLNSVSAEIKSLRKDLSKMSNKKDYTGNFVSLVSLLKSTQNLIEKSSLDKTALTQEISSIKNVFMKLDGIIRMIDELGKNVDKATDKQEIMDAIKSLNAIIRKLSMTREDMNILQAFGHKFYQE